MDRYGRQERPPSRRRPLSDAAHRVNIGSSSPSDHEKFRPPQSSRSSLPHHESLIPNGPHTVKNITTSPEDKRLSALTYEEQLESKRNSQVSTTSTNASAKGKRRKTHIGPWQLGVELGKGGCGRVRKVRHSLTGQEAAAKIISKKVAEQARAQSLANLAESSGKAHAGSLKYGKVMPFGVEREVVIMKLLEHENVVRLYDVWENKNELYLIMEYVEGGELFEFVERNQYLEEDQTVFLFRQVIAALLHCHRLGIHHRDLKPENILLEPETATVKLVDFGMAALQPRGKNLTTPCGSIHYAAPDVLERSYDGGKADVWSCGIILYVMLTGNTPFQYDPANDVSVWYQTLKCANIFFPHDMSPEAKDLIKRILEPEPSLRISLEDIWNHPLLHKYDDVWKLTEEQTRLEIIRGPRPVIDKWSIKTKSDVDREILRNLRTLWHSEKEATLIEKLLNKDGNQEKYFYAALKKYREQQLENYVGMPAGMDCSASDHHHVALDETKSAPPIPPMPAVRNKSQFSILNDEHLKSMSSLHGPSPSVGSYDPYRASPDSMVGTEGGYMNVTVHRNMSRVSRKQNSVASQRRPDSMRISALKQGHLQHSAATTPRAAMNASASQKSSVGSKRTLSRASIATSLYSSSPPAATAKPRLTKKRGVQFEHQRKGSATSAPSTRHNSSANLKSARTPRSSVKDVSILPSSPERTVTQDMIVRSRKENHFISSANPAQTGRSNSQVIESEARKVSTELEKFCEQAFFRSSAASSGQTSRSEKVSSYETPPSSLSQGPSPPMSRSSKLEAFQGSNQYSSRPLPDLPPDTPNTIIARELAETRKRLLTQFSQNDGPTSSAYQEVLAHLDALMQVGAASSFSSDSRRITSAPEQRSQSNMVVLPIISEEGRTGDIEQDGHSSQRLTIAARAFTDPTQQAPTPTSWRSSEPGTTVRLVSPTSLPQVAPLNIRKRSGETVATQSLGESKFPNGSSKSLRAHLKFDAHDHRASKKASADELLENTSDDTIRDAGSKAFETAAQRKTSWFWKRAQPRGLERFDKTLTDSNAKVPAEAPRADVEQSPGNADLAGASPDAGLRTGERKESGSKKGFRRFLGKRSASKEQQENPTQLEVRDTASSTLDTSPGPEAAQRHTLDPVDAEATSRDLGVQRNWLARFLHIKPASKILCLEVGRGRARQDLFRLLKSWKKFGMCDVKLDRLTNVVYGRLSPDNYLQMKEIAFTAEIFVVLEAGRRAKLSVVRFTQQKGAASSFRRVVDAIEEVFHRKGYLMEDRAKCKDLYDVLGVGSKA